MRKMFLPNTQFFFNLGDWPLQEKQKSNTVAFVSWCGSEGLLFNAIYSFDRIPFLFYIFLFFSHISLIILSQNFHFP